MVPICHVLLDKYNAVNFIKQYEDASCTEYFVYLSTQYPCSIFMLCMRLSLTLPAVARDVKVSIKFCSVLFCYTTCLEMQIKLI